MMNAIAAAAAWILVTLCGAVLLLSIAVGVFYVSALALVTGVALVGVAVWRPGAHVDRVVVLRPRGDNGSQGAA